ncbi:MAG: FliM/FliN family flagellar motor switch protein [Proteobacteria bacterium]|nr:FliM/FliN family flagellar motor switch protein [Pseudomonadota bacterium]
MEPILSKPEIADLLKAIRDGKVSLDLDENKHTQFLACTPANLFQLTRPDNKQFRIPNFDIILDTFCRSYASSLSNQLQRSLSITRTELESYEFQKFMAGKTNPGAIGILDMNPLKYGAMIILDPVLSFSVLEIMLGASSELQALHLDRRLTALELTILKSIISDACNDLNKAFSQLLEMHSVLIKLENNARLVSIVEPEAEVIVGTFLIKIGDHSGKIHLIFPFATLEPLRDSLKELLSIATIAKSSWQSVLEDEVRDVPATITALSGNITLSINQILNLQKGDILDLDYDPNTPLKVLVEDKVKFFAIPGTHNGKKAISLTGVYS